MGTMCINDMGRVREMIDHYNKGGYIPRMIHLAEIKEESVVCYDGNHRKEVFNQCNDDTALCIVDVMFSACQNDVYKVFNSINKSVQLPAIYIEEPTSDANNAKEAIINLVKSYETKYKALLSTSARCHAPNFNRDGFTDNIYNIYLEFNRTLSIEEIGELLEKVNKEYAQGRLCRPHSMYRPAVIEKCKTHDMWLFIDKTIPFEHIVRLM